MTDRDTQFKNIDRRLRTNDPPEVPDGLLEDLLKNVFDCEASNDSSTAPPSAFYFGSTPTMVAVVFVALFLVSFFAVVASTRDRHVDKGAVSNSNFLETMSWETDPQFIVPPVDTGEFSEAKIAGSPQRLDTANSAWLKSAVDSDGLQMSVAADEGSDEGALFVSNIREYPTPVCNNWKLNLPTIPFGARIQLKAAVRTINASLVNICIQCWAKDQSLIGFCSTPLLNGTQEWTEVVSDGLVVPDNTDQITVRASLAGTGQAWFNDLRIFLGEGDNQVRRANTRVQEEVDPEIARLIEQLGTIRDHKFEALNRLIDIGIETEAPLREILGNKKDTQIRRWQSAMILSNVDSRHAIPEMFDILKEADENERILHGVIIQSLFNYRDEEVIRQLRELTGSADLLESIRRKIRLTIADPAFYPFAEQEASSESGNDKLDASRELELLARSSPDVIAWMKTIGTSTDRQFTAFRMLKTKSASALEQPLLQVLASEQQPLIRRWQSAMILSDKRIESAIPVMLLILKNNKEREEVLQHVLVQCLGKYFDQSLIRLNLEEIASRKETLESTRHKIQNLLQTKENVLEN